MKTQEKIKYQLYNDGEIFDIFENEEAVIERANESRKDYIEVEADPGYIEEYFPDEITTFEKAKAWFKGLGDEILFTKETELVRILTKAYKDNSYIAGSMKYQGRDDYFDQGTWKYSIKILDINPDNIARIQLTARKICPSGLWDNGIEKTYSPLISLYIRDDLQGFVTYVIKNHFYSDRYSGRDYSIQSVKLIYKN